MTSNQKFIGGLRVNRGMITTGAALTGIGAVLAATGATLVCVALANAGRSWIHRLETQPAELAHHALHRAKAASAAGLEAWRANGT
ncbi:hypothetical protein [Kitasatospora cheerisanensis]|uniref:Uncharacterized protein n=1 Tax=Kitasatospora cheerisanensis KCTC 2395 TaxID=1348663 RepID=A0A066YXM7_9ACTN|nr:hypothetical protein [Kitasatospora cheerisanensis]KDN84714.1 hypothetical protein KCH_35790 [Kitasatospora cheerisanensis KCTC 2395]